MHDQVEPRGVPSTILMTLPGVMVGLFWIGRPGLAMMVLIAQALSVALILWFGFPPMDVGGLPLLVASLLVAGLAFVLCFRKRSRRRGWSSRWYAA